MWNAEIPLSCLVQFMQNCVKIQILGFYKKLKPIKYIEQPSEGSNYIEFQEFNFQKMHWN